MERYLRRLSVAESAYTYCNEKSPLSVVIVIHIKGALSIAELKEKLQRLQVRHILLQAIIEKKGRNYCFKIKEPIQAIPVALLERVNDNTWESAVEEALNTTFDTKKPLMRLLYIKGPGVNGELLLTIHHSIIDGIGARLILTDFLKLLGGQKLRNIQDKVQSHTYPKAYLGFSGLSRKMSFMGKQMVEEISFALKSKKNPPPTNSYNRILSFRLSEETSQRIIKKSGDLGLSMNSLIGAAMLQAVRELDTSPKPKAMRAVIFADMRSKMQPPVPRHALGCYISMARFTLMLDSNDPLVTTAKKLWRQLYISGKKGHMYMYAMMSLQVIKLMMTLKKFRLADIALSYIGVLELKPRYGEIEVEDVKAFITNNRFGPTLTAFALCLFGRIGVNLNYLPAELSTSQAKAIALRTQKLLEDFA